MLRLPPVGGPGTAPPWLRKTGNQPTPSLPPGMGFTPTGPSRLPPDRSGNQPMPQLPPGMGYNPTAPSRPRPPGDLVTPTPRPDPLLPPDRGGISFTGGSSDFDENTGTYRSTGTDQPPGGRGQPPRFVGNGTINGPDPAAPGGSSVRLPGAVAQSGVVSPYNPTGAQVITDPVTGRQSFAPQSGVMGIDKYRTPTGDGFTGVRNGQNFVNGHLFAAEGLNQGDASNPLGAGFGNWLARHREQLGGTAATYQVPQVNMGAALPVPGAAGGGVIDDPSGSALKGGGVAELPRANPGLASYANSGAPAYGPGSPGGASPGPSGAGSGSVQGGQGGFNPSAMFGGADMSGLPGVDTDFSGQAQRGAEAAYRGATQFFNPDFERDTNALENRLINQGFARGSEAFNEEMGRLQRGQMAARTGAAFTAQGVGHNQAGDLLMRALQTRGQLAGERERGADRNLSRYGIDTNAELSRRGLGLGEDNQAFQQLMALIASSRGGVNMPNFGAPQPLDVGSAYGIAGRANEAEAARRAADRAGMYSLGAAALGGIDWGSLFGG